MRKELAKLYDPKEVEDDIYRSWLDGKYFHANVDREKEPYTIVIPPPNVTGQLHMGHALDNTMQDILIRFRRMQGYSALWLPGTDHAGIATQIKVEEELRVKEGKTRYDLGREKFLERVWEWKNLYGGTIINQLKKLGASCDWERERFTMDEGCSKAVRAAFVDLYEKGLIYRGNRIINWCPNCTTALSDAEVEYCEKEGNFWHLRYPVKDSSEFVVVATTRPETMLGDAAVAVHPEDERYRHLIGKTVLLPLVDREIPIIADDYVDREFGTGCVKITPCHDPNDFEVGQRHDLEQVLVMDEDAKINQNGGKYNGLERYEARKAIIADLEKLGLLERVQPHTHNVGECYRCGTTVEPITSRQWFVSMKPLSGEAIRVVKDGQVQFVPERFGKIYMNWMENVHDWCISRQLWWGHRIPAYYCADCEEMVVSKEEVHICPKCASKNVTQEQDVLDTWFSSGLWPFSTLGWPEKTEELSAFFPTSVLVTSYDIIFFWVARMIFLSLEQMKEIPFKTVFIHGLVRDSKGRKMSKSLGNGIDPLEIIDQYGADALRFSLATGNSPGNDMRFYTERVEASRNFANKIWNAARFIMMNLTIDKNELPENPSAQDKWILSKYNTLVKEVTENIEKFELGVAVQKLYDFIWDVFCDWYIEISKPRLSKDSADEDASLCAQKTLCYVLSNTLKLLHPFMPFITEEIWRTLPHEGESIMVSPWPVYDKGLSFPREESDTETVMAAVRAIRNRRSEMNVPPSKKARIYIETQHAEVFSQGEEMLKRLASGSSVEISDSFSLDNAVLIVTDSARIFLPLDELVDKEKEKEIARLTAERGKLTLELEKLSKQLGNENFVAKAPPALVAQERERAGRLTAQIEKIRESLMAFE